MNKLMLKVKAGLKKTMVEEIECRRHGDILSERFQEALNKKTVYRTIISMCPEVNKKPEDITDDEVIGLFKKYLKQEKVRMLYTSKYLTSSDVEGKSSKEVSILEKEKLIELDKFLINGRIKIIQSYLPPEISVQEIKDFIKTIDINLPFGKKMGIIMKTLKGVNGAIVKEVLNV